MREKSKEQRVGELYREGRRNKERKLRWEMEKEGERDLKQ